MSEAFSSSLGVVAYLALFTAVGIVFLFVEFAGRASSCGRQIRTPRSWKSTNAASRRSARSFVQFDLRFYVVALLFIIFDVEVAFFFPWAAVFGKADEPDGPAVAVRGRAQAGVAGADGRRPRRCIRSWAVRQPTVAGTGARFAARPNAAGASCRPRESARQLACRSSTSPPSSPCCWSALPTCGSGAISMGAGRRRSSVPRDRAPVRGATIRSTKPALSA